MLPYFTFLNLKLYSYPLIMGMVWAISYHLALFLIETRKDKLKSYKFYFVGVFLASWIGAKVFYLVTLNLEIVKKAALSSSFWLGGGFVFYGGLIFGLIFTFAFGFFTKQPIKKFTFAIPVLCLGHAVGRIGCLLAGCCFGSITDFAFHIHLHGANRHPVQLYEAITLFILFLITFNFYKSGKKVVIFYLGSYSILRFLLEFLRGDAIRGENLIWLLSTSQIISLFIFILVILNSGFVKFRR